MIYNLTFIVYVYLEADPVDMVLDEEKELLGDAKDPGWLVTWEEPAISLVPDNVAQVQIHIFKWTNMPRCTKTKKYSCQRSPLSHNRSSTYRIIFSGRSNLTS